MFWKQGKSEVSSQKQTRHLWCILNIYFMPKQEKWGKLLTFTTFFKQIYPSWRHATRTPSCSIKQPFNMLLFLFLKLFHVRSTDEAGSILWFFLSEWVLHENTKIELYEVLTWRARFSLFICAVALHCCPKTLLLNEHRVHSAEHKMCINPQWKIDQTNAHFTPV